MSLVSIISGSSAHDYQQSVILFQRLPRILIAIYVGGIMACCGFVFQGLIRNPLASSSSLGVNAGATLFVVTSALVFQFDILLQGIAAISGGISGFVVCWLVSKCAGSGNNQSGLSLILGGAIVTMLLIGLSNAILLSYPLQRSEYLSWISGNINHAYIDRLYMFWWIGLIILATFGSLCRPLTLILLGLEKASSMGVNTTIISAIALSCAIIGASSAVAICGPIGFIGLIVPHLVRPLVGEKYSVALPACALCGAILCIFADFISHIAFKPYVLNTGIILDISGGIAFICIIRKFYVASHAARDA